MTTKHNAEDLIDFHIYTLHQFKAEKFQNMLILEPKPQKNSRPAHTFNQSLSGLPVFSDEEGTQEEKQSAQDPNKYADQQAVL